MVRPQNMYRRRSLLSQGFGIVALVVLLGSGLVGLLLWLQVLPNPWGQAAEDPFMVRIPINSQAIPAYTRVERTHLMLDRTGKFAFQRIPPGSTVGMSILGVANDGSLVDGRVTAVRRDEDRVVFVVEDGREVPQEKANELGGALLNPNTIIGRVVKRDKRPGMGFRQDTFFPQGTPEGIAGATPVGMKALTLDATKLAGVHALRTGDRVDLLASVPVNQLAAFAAGGHERIRGSASPSGHDDDDKNEAVEPVLLAQNAVVLKPVHMRQEASTSSSLTQGKRVQNLPKYEVTLAVVPDDLIPLQSAVNKSLSITCVAHSMQAAAQPSAATETTTPASDVVMVPVTVRPTLAYEVVTREAFISAATRRVRQEPLDRDEAARLGVILTLEEALGAVARHDIPAGSFVRRSDLLSGAVAPRSGAEPSGRRAAVEWDQRTDTAPWRMVAQASSAHATTNTQGPRAQLVAQGADDAPPTVIGDRPTIASFIPPGQTAFAIPWNRLYGAEHLQIGDHIDVLASFALERTGRATETETRPDGTVVERQRDDVTSRPSRHLWDESMGLRAEPWFVATEATVVGPVGFPPPAAAQRALAQRAANQQANADRDGSSGPPLIVAVDERDVTALAAALAAQGTIFTVAIHGAESQPLAAGWRRVAVAAHELEAYEVFSDSIWLGNRRRPVERVVREDDPRYQNALDVGQLADHAGQTLATSKRRGEPFFASDFLPAAYGAGLSAATRPGYVLCAVAEREIKGLATFPANAWVAVLERRKMAAPADVIVHGNLGDRVIAAVVVPQARIVRAPRGGQVILEVPQTSVTRLHAKWAEVAAADSADDQAGARSSLIAVAVPPPPGVGEGQGGRDAPLSASSKPPAAPALPAASGPPGVTTPVEPAAALDQAIPTFDSAPARTTVETVVGSKRQRHVFMSDAAETAVRPMPTGADGR